MGLIPRDDTRGITIIALCSVFLPLSAIAVALRIWSRAIKGKALVLNDYMILVALALTTMFAALLIASVVAAGAGQHINAISENQVALLAKMFVAAEIGWSLTNSAVKISILDLYQRTFPLRSFRIATYTMMAFTVVYLLIVVLEAFFLCKPFAYNWDQTIEGGSCADRKAAFLSAGILNLLIDVTIVSLPMPMLWGLRIRPAKKAAICGIFGIGYGICVITILRVTAILDLVNQDFPYSIAPSGYWSILEPTLGIVNACLPVLKPVTRKLWGRQALSSATSDPAKEPGNMRHLRTFSPQHPGGHSQLSRFRRLDDGDRFPLQSVTGTRTSVTGSRSISEEDGEGIRIKTDWNVHSNSFLVN